MQLKTKAGLALVALGIGIFGVWNWWTKTRNFVPLSVPISLAAGQGISPGFKLNFDALYLIEIDAQKTLPPDTLHCLMGLEADPARCKGTPSAIAANWVLSSKNQVIKRGSSAELHTVPAETETISRVIGEFHGKTGQQYELQVTITTDGTPLAVAHPRLKVAAASIAYTDLQSAGALVISMVCMCLLFGAILLGIALYASRATGVV